MLKSRQKPGRGFDVKCSRLATNYYCTYAAGHGERTAKVDVSDLLNRDFYKATNLGRIIAIFLGFIKKGDL